MNSLLVSVVEIVLFLIASYLIFYKSWLKSLGKEMAKLSTIEELTTLTEAVKEEFKVRLEAYKSRLNEELTLKIEPLKGELAKNNITHQIQFSFLHQERAKVVLDLYRKLIELHSAMVDWTGQMHLVVQDGNKEEEERNRRAAVALNDFRNFYLLNKLFFSTSLCKYLDGTLKEYWELAGDFGFAKNIFHIEGASQENYNIFRDQMTKISKNLKENLPSKIEQIESEFRKILNVEDDT